MADGERVLGFQETPLVPGSAVGRLGDAAAAAEAALASRDTTQAADPVVAPVVAAVADPAVAATALAAAKTAADAKKATDVTAAEAVLAAAKTPEEKVAAQKALDILKGPTDTPGVAPEKYEPFTLPKEITPDPAAIAAFEGVAKGLNLSQSQAQALVDFDTKRAIEQGTKAAEAQTKAWNTLLETRLSEAKADPVIGGQNWDASVTSARAAITAFGTPALQAYLNQSDAGSHVEIVRFFAAVGKAVQDDSVHFGGKQPQPADISLAKRLFPNDK
ncbi:MAG TPA: hypothetical protein VFE77_02995 [Rhodanobacter sp.]|nr:hypothetical protein [Rhodanobacter sp.]